jgi:hypothetical protein
MGIPRPALRWAGQGVLLTTPGLPQLHPGGGGWGLGVALAVFCASFQAWDPEVLLVFYSPLPLAWKGVWEEGMFRTCCSSA